MKPAWDIIRRLAHLLPAIDHEGLGAAPEHLFHTEADRHDVIEPFVQPTCRAGEGLLEVIPHLPVFQEGSVEVGRGPAEAGPDPFVRVVESQFLEDGENDPDVLGGLVATVEVEPLAPDAGHVSPHLVAVLEDQGALSQLLQVEAGDEPGDPSADDNDVVFIGSHFF